jgi:hypothetical protein
MLACASGQRAVWRLALYGLMFALPAIAAALMFLL